MLSERQGDPNGDALYSLPIVLESGKWRNMSQWGGHSWRMRRKQADDGEFLNMYSGDNCHYETLENLFRQIGGVAEGFAVLETQPTGKH